MCYGMIGRNDRPYLLAVDAMPNELVYLVIWKNKQQGTTVPHSLYLIAFMALLSACTSVNVVPVSSLWLNALFVDILPQI